MGPNGCQLSNQRNVPSIITHFGPDERSHSVPQVQQFPPTPGGTVIGNGDAPRSPTFQEVTINSGSPDGMWVRGNVPQMSGNSCLIPIMNSLEAKTPFLPLSGGRLRPNTLAALEIPTAPCQRKDLRIWSITLHTSFSAKWKCYSSIQ